MDPVYEKYKAVVVVESPVNVTPSGRRRGGCMYHRPTGTITELGYGETLAAAAKAALKASVQSTGSPEVGSSSFVLLIPPLHPKSVTRKLLGLWVCTNGI